MGTGVEDIVHCVDFAAKEEYIQVDTRIYKTSANASAFDSFVRGMPGRVAKTATTDAMLQFLLTEVDSQGRSASGANRAKNMFRAAFGAPFVASGQSVAPADGAGESKRAAKKKPQKK